MAGSQLIDEVMETVAPDLPTGSVEDGDYLYKMADGMSIPVPKKFGKMWQKRIDDAAKTYETEHALWDTVFRMYRETSVEENPADPLVREYSYQLRNSTDENIIRTNIRTIMRSTYMRNPHIEYTSVNSGDDPQVEVLQQAMDFLLNKRTYPGLNMKPKARRWILHSQLTNHGVVRLDYQDKTGSLDEARAELEHLEEELKTAKSKDDIDAAVAKIQLLYEQMPLLEGKGIKLSNVLPHKVIIDPNCTTIELSDANWVAEFFDLDTIYMKEKYYREEDGDTIRISDGKSVDAVSETDREATEKSVLNMVMNDQQDERRRYRLKGTTECCYVYDRTLRRCYLFNTEDWSYPLWVYEDDLKLSRFFRHFIMAFTETVDSIVQPGEASYVVGQVNEINKINRKAKEIRDSAFGALIYDKEGIDKEEVLKLVDHLKNPNKLQAFGIKKDTDKKLSEVVMAWCPPAFDYQSLFNTNSLRSSIDKNFALSDIDRGEQFNSNTTNDAVKYYQENKQQATGVLIDSIEDAFESLGWAMSELIVSKFTKDDIQAMLGPTWAQKFLPMTVEEFNQKYRMVIASGSIEKPTTEYKKQEAIKIAQAIGQFAQAAPATAMRVIMKLFETAFSTFVVKKDDWDMLEDEAQANLKKGVSTDDTSNQPTSAPAKRGP